VKHAQPRLDRLGAYPFGRLQALLAGKSPPPDREVIDAGAGEPHLPLPEFLPSILNTHLDGFSKYPPTRGAPFLHRAIAAWLERRYGLKKVDPTTQVLAANGTREALFAVAHALVNPEAGREKPCVPMPNPMYQIYLGAAITAGAEPYFMPCTQETGFAPDLEAVPDSVWRRTAFIYVCSPSNPTGWIADMEWYARLFALADRFDFFIVGDECYSEIFREREPPGLLETAARLGREGFSRCLCMNSLSKRSALPGLRSGFIAGDAALIARFAKLRTYTGPATPLPLQHVAAAAWSDEDHVRKNRAIYRRSLRVFFDALGRGGPPPGGFFAWLPVGDDEAFAAAAFEEQAVVVLPGSFLAADDRGVNPGHGYVRVGSSRVDLQACKLEYSIVSPK
jgi:Aspartate/tyrosine/aromatic aminotransferase